MGNTVSNQNISSFDDALLNRLKEDYPDEYSYYQSGGMAKPVNQPVNQNSTSLGSFDKTNTTSQVGRQLFGPESFDLQTEKVLVNKMNVPRQNQQLSLPSSLQNQQPPSFPPLQDQQLPPLQDQQLSPLQNQQLPQLQNQQQPSLSQDGVSTPFSTAPPPTQKLSMAPDMQTEKLIMPPTSNLDTPFPGTPTVNQVSPTGDLGQFTQEQLVRMDRDQLNDLCQNNLVVKRLVCSGKSVSNDFWRQRTQQQFPDTKPGMLSGFDKNDDWLMINFLRNAFRNIEKNDPRTNNKWNFNSMGDIRNHITKNCDKLDLTGGEIKNIPDKLALKRAIGLEKPFELIIWTKSETI